MIAISRFMSSMGRTISAKSVQATRQAAVVCQPVWKSKFYGAFTPSTRRLNSTAL